MKPFKAPESRQKFRSIYFSFASSTVIWWFLDFDGNFTIYRDLHLENHTAEMLAERVRELEEENGEWNEDRDRGSKLIGVLGPAAAWGADEKTGLSNARTMRTVGILCRPASEDLATAADQIRMRLIRRTLAKGAPKDDPGVPGPRYFKSCEWSLETVPSIPADKTERDLPEPKTEATAYKALCYSCMSRPMIPQKVKSYDDEDGWTKPKTARKSRTGIPGVW